MRILLIIFILIPMIEIATFIQAGELLGTANTILLIFFTAIIGVLLIRQQGLETLLRANQKMNTGEVPAVEMLEGLVLAVAGVLLITPGFFTDSIGFLLLIPVLRRKLILGLIAGHIVRPVDNGTYRTTEQRQGQGPRTIEGDYIRRDKED